MSYQSRKLWEEILGGIDEKYTAEAAEKLYKANGGDIDIPTENAVPLEIKPQPVTKKKRPFVWASVGAAAVIALAVGATLFFGRGQLPVTSTPETSETGETNEPDETEDILTEEDEDVVTELIELEYEPFPFAPTWDIFELDYKFDLYDSFCGEWQAVAEETESRSPETLIINRTDRTLDEQFDCDKLVGFYENEGDGIYMRIELFDEDGSSTAAYMCYVPYDAPSNLFVYLDPTVYTRRTQYIARYYRTDYASDKGEVLNFMGETELCLEMGASTGAFDHMEITDVNGNKWERNISPSTQALLDPIVLHEKTDERMTFSAKFCPADEQPTADNVRYFCLTADLTSGEEPVLCTYDIDEDDTVIDTKQPSRTNFYSDTLCFDPTAFEKYFMGSWTNEDNFSPESISMTYNDSLVIFGENSMPDVYLTEGGAYLTCTAGGAGQFFFVSEDDPDTMYYYMDFNTLENTARNDYDEVFHRTGYPDYSDLTISGIITRQGWEKLYNVYGEPLKTEIFQNILIEEYNGVMLYGIQSVGDPPEPETQYILKAMWEPVLIDSTATMLKIAIPFDRTLPDSPDPNGRLYYVYTFTLKNGEWSFVDALIDPDLDTTPLDIDGKDGIDLDVYENYFIGRWAPDDLGRGINVNFHEDMFTEGGSSYLTSVYQGIDGWYATGTINGVMGIYYIPDSNGNVMYYYNDNDYYGRKNSYTAVYHRTRETDESDYEIRLNTNLNPVGIEKLCEMYGDDFKKAYYSFALSNAVISDAGAEWLCQESAPASLKLIGEKNVLMYTCFIKTDTIGTAEPLESYFAHTITYENGKWNVVQYTELDYSYNSGDEQNATMDMGIYEHFISKWADANGAGSITLSYKEDIFTPVTDICLGFMEKDDGWYMYRQNDSLTVYYIPKANSQQMFVYPYDSESYIACYNRITAAPITTVTNGGLSYMGFEKLKTMYGTSLGYCLDEFLNGKLEIGMYDYYYSSGAAQTALEQVMVLSLEEKSITLALPMYSVSAYEDDRMTTLKSDAEPYLFAVTYKNFTGTNWELYETLFITTSINNVTEQFEMDNGDLYYIADSINDEYRSVYHYDATLEVYYLLKSNFIDPKALYTNDMLFVMGADGQDGEVYLYRFVGGESYGARAIDYSEADHRPDFVPGALETSGDYLLASFYGNGEMHYGVFDMYGIYSPNAVIDPNTIERIDIENNGFTVHSDGESVFYNTTGDSLEGMLPILKSRHSDVWRITHIEGDSLLLSYGSTTPWVELKGLKMFESDVPIFPDYQSFVDYVEFAFTEECAEEILSECAHIAEYDGKLYSSGGARGSDLGVHHIEEELVMIDDNTAELRSNVYGYKDFDNDISADEPKEQYTQTLIKTPEGWRFTSMYSPY